MGKTAVVLYVRVSSKDQEGDAIPVTLNLLSWFGRSFCLLSLMLTMGGCATVGTMRSAPIAMGTPRTFSAGAESVLRATQEALAHMGLKIKEQYKADDDTSVIIASEGINAVSWGVLVRVVVQKVTDSETAVYVHTKRRLATNILAEGDFSQPLLWNIQGRLR